MARVDRWDGLAGVPIDLLARRPRYVASDRERRLPQLEPARLPEAAHARRRPR